MTDQEIRAEQETRRALLSAFLTVGMRPLPNSEGALLAKLQELGVIADLSAGYLKLNQAGTEISLSGACERLRKELPQLFASDPRHDAVSSREDLERGTAQEIAKAKAAYISQYGYNAYAALPQTKKQAALKTAPVNVSMTRAEWLALPSAERARLCSVLEPDTLAKIISRKGSGSTESATVLAKQRWQQILRIRP
jgi:hypothetical protein